MYIFFFFDIIKLVNGMNEKLKDQISTYFGVINPIFDRSTTNFNDLQNEIYEKILNRNGNLVYISQFAVNEEIIDLLVTESVKANYSEDFRYAYIYVADRVKDVYNESGQVDKTILDVEKLAFKIIVTSIIYGYDMKEFNHLSLDGFIDQFALADINEENSVRRQKELLERELREENKMKNIQIIRKLPRDFVNGLIAILLATGVLIAGNIFIQLFKMAIEKIESKKESEPKKLTEMTTVKEALNELGLYDYENNEYIRS